MAESLCLCLVLASLLGFSVGELQVYTNPTLKILPDYDGRLNSFTFLTCIIEPKNASVVSRWLLPSGDIVSSRNASLSGRLVVNEGMLALSEGTMFGTVLVIQRVSYRDSGVYTCEVREVDGEQCECDGEWPAVTSAELQLQASLHAIVDIVTAQDTDSEVELYCEMTGFIRPDADLQWFHEDQPITTETNDRTSILFTDGIPNAAQSGGNNTRPGRVSILIVSKPVVTDSGMYTCRIRGTDESAHVQLIVEAGPMFIDFPADDSISSSSSSSSSSCSRVTAIAVSLTFVCAAVLTAIITACAVLLWQRNHSLTSKLGIRNVDVFDDNCISTVVGNKLSNKDGDGAPDTV